MIYCIVEGKTDCIILTKVFDIVKVEVKIIVSNGFPSMPAVARTIIELYGARGQGNDCL